MKNKVQYLQVNVDYSNGPVVTVWATNPIKRYTISREDYNKAFKQHEQWCKENGKRFNVDKMITKDTEGVKEA